MKQDHIGIIVAITLGVLFGLWAVVGCSPNAVPSTQAVNAQQADHDALQLTLTDVEAALAVAELAGVIPAPDAVLVTKAEQQAQDILNTWESNITQPLAAQEQAQFNAALADLQKIWLASKTTAMQVKAAKLHP